MSLASKTGQVFYNQPGSMGPLVYPAGEYSAAETYTRTELSAPVVLCEGEYYVLNKDGEITGINPKDDYTENGTDAHWIRMQKFKYAFVEVLMANFAKLASAVFSGDFMFSQYGKDAQGNSSSDYQNFDPDNYGNGMSPFTPNMLIDWLTGKLFGLKVDIKGGDIGGFSVDGYDLRNKDNTNAMIRVNTEEYGSEGQAIKRSSVLGNYVPGMYGYDCAGYHAATGPKENRALILRASGSNNRHYVYGGYDNLCIDAVGGINWRMNEEDQWCMPGFLCWIDINIVYGRNPPTQSTVWGNGISIKSVYLEGAVTGNGEVQKVVVEYYTESVNVRPLAINCSNCWNGQKIWDLNPIVEESNTYVGVEYGKTVRCAKFTFWYSGAKYIPARCIIMFFGESTPFGESNS